MNLHEYQARAVLKAAGIPVPDGDVATTPAEAEAIARRVGGTVVIKAQVHAGGRGKAGGVKLAKTPGEAAEHASRILGMKIKGLVVSKVLVVPAADIASEAYVGLIVDRETQRPVFMVSPAGGIDIEEVAAKTPEKIFKLAVDPRYGLLSHQALGLGVQALRRFPAGARRRQDHGAALQRVHGQRRLARRDQSAGDDAGWRGGGARREDLDRRQRAGAAARPRRASRRDARKRPRRWKRAARASPSSSSTATWAAW